MVEIASENLSGLLRNQQMLPDELRQSCVMLCFEEPVCSALLQEFMTIRLTDLMHKAGEDNFYLVNRYQPERMGPRNCPRCRQQLHPLSLNEFRCTNRRCPMSATDGVVSGPRSGILAVKIAPEFVIHSDGPNDYVDRDVLVLDRRYEPHVLAGILRTAYWIAEERGWKMK